MDPKYAAQQDRMLLESTAQAKSRADREMQPMTIYRRRCVGDIDPVWSVRSGEEGTPLFAIRQATVQPAVLGTSPGFDQHGVKI